MFFIIPSFLNLSYMLVTRESKNNLFTLSICFRNGIKKEDTSHFYGLWSGVAKRTPFGNVFFCRYTVSSSSPSALKRKNTNVNWTVFNHYEKNTDFCEFWRKTISWFQIKKLHGIVVYNHFVLWNSRANSKRVNGLWLPEQRHQKVGPVSAIYLGVS